MLGLYGGFHAEMTVLLSEERYTSYRDIWGIFNFQRTKESGKGV